MIVMNAVVIVSEVVGRSALAGRQRGEQDAPVLRQAAREVAVDQRVVLDLQGVDFLSASYFDAALWPLWSKQLELFPILRHVPADMVDEVYFVLKEHSAGVWIDAGKNEPSVIGPLDDTLKKTLMVVTSRSGTTAGELADLDSSASATGMSNRLAALYDMRLVRRRKEGRQLVYVAAWKEDGRG
jgi:DNA-binding transcriptional ArsR family regulator